MQPNAVVGELKACGRTLVQVKKTAQMAAMAAAANNLAKNFDFSKALEQMQQELQDKRSKS